MGQHKGTAFACSDWNLAKRDLLDDLVAGWDCLDMPEGALEEFADEYDAALRATSLAATQSSRRKRTMNTKTALQIAKEINVSALRKDAKTILEAFENAKDSSDFTVDFGRSEYRIIHDDEIETIHRASIEEMVDDCYDLEGMKKKMGNLADYMEFDYDSFARDCRMSDGYGHHFASYDGEEIEVENWHIFRTN